MDHTLKNHLISKLQAEKGKKKPDEGVIVALAYAAAKLELEIAAEYVAREDLFQAEDHTISAKSLLEDIKEFE